MDDDDWKGEDKIRTVSVAELERRKAAAARAAEIDRALAYAKEAGWVCNFPGCAKILQHARRCQTRYCYEHVFRGRPRSGWPPEARQRQAGAKAQELGVAGDGDEG